MNRISSCSKYDCKQMITLRSILRSRDYNIQLELHDYNIELGSYNHDII